jgi:hypothetical protein
LEISTFSFRKKHYVAIGFAVALVVLMVAEFSSFAVGAYFVYDVPISNVVAETAHSGSSTSLVVQATGLTKNSTRTIWVDPEISYYSNGSPVINPNSGFKIENVKTSPNGTIFANYSIPASTLQEIEADGQSIHAVWIVGLNSSLSFQLTSDSEQNYTTATTGDGIIFFFLLITFVVPIHFNLGGLFLALWTIYIILFAMAMNGPIRNIVGATREASRKGVKSLFDNSMYATLIVFPVIVWLTVVIALIEQAGGVSTGSLPPTDPLLEYIELALAPLREELGFRVVPIGLAALAILFSRGKLRDGLLALWHPSRYLKKNDSPEQYRRNLILIYVMIGISAFAFGLAHVLLGAGWGPGKILSAAIAGVGLAGLYYVYGFPATVLLHWSIDYFLQTYTLTPSLENGIGVWITFYTIALAIAGSVVLIILFARTLRSRSFRTIFSNRSPALN